MKDGVLVPGFTTEAASRAKPGRWLVILLVVGVLVGLSIVNYRFAHRAPGGNDFLPRWVGARAWLVEGLSPYDPRVSLAAQQLIYGRPADASRGEDIAHFVYPLPAMLFFAPFALMPFTLARAAWMTLLEIGLAALASIGIRTASWPMGRRLIVPLTLFSVLWYHGARSIIVGQFAVIEAVLMCGALWAIGQGRDRLAGAMLALSIAKPQMAVLLVPLVILWGISVHRRALVGWTLGGITALLIVSWILLPGWPAAWLRQLIDYPSYTELGSPISILGGFLGSAGPAVTYGLSALLAMYLLWEWRLVWKRPVRWLQWTAALTIVITNLIVVRTATTNYVVLLPSLCIVFAAWTRPGARGARLAVLGGLAGLWVGLWALFLATVQGNAESAWMYLPMPLLTLAGLLAVRGRTIRTGPQTGDPDAQEHEGTLTAPASAAVWPTGE